MPNNRYNLDSVGVKTNYKVRTLPRRGFSEVFAKGDDFSTGDLFPMITNLQEIEKRPERLPAASTEVLRSRLIVPTGSASDASIISRSGASGGAIQERAGTGIYFPTGSPLEVAVTVDSVQRVVIDTIKALFANDIWFKSNTAFFGKFLHNITADREWTFPDVSGQVALTSGGTTGTKPVEIKEAHVSLFLEHPEHIC